LSSPAEKLILLGLSVDSSCHCYRWPWCPSLLEAAQAAKLSVGSSCHCLHRPWYSLLLEAVEAEGLSAPARKQNFLVLSVGSSCHCHRWPWCPSLLETVQIPKMASLVEKQMLSVDPSFGIERHQMLSHCYCCPSCPSSVQVAQAGTPPTSETASTVWYRLTGPLTRFPLAGSGHSPRTRS
jgi:hypothetical protein